MTKEERREYNKQYREIHKEYYQHYALNYRKENRKNISLYYREYYRKKGRKRSPDYIEKIIVWQKNNPLKVRARQILKNAIEYGRIKRSMICEICDRYCRTHGHHEDYFKPLDVNWLCASCHKLLHNKKNNLTILI